jgi:hypothetical protein
MVEIVSRQFGVETNKVKEQDFRRTEYTELIGFACLRCWVIE